MNNNSLILREFPSDEIEALAFLYLKNQDLSSISPTEIYNIYKNAYDEISEVKKAKRQEKFNNSQSENQIY